MMKRFSSLFPVAVAALVLFGTLLPSGAVADTPDFDLSAGTIQDNLIHIRWFPSKDQITDIDHFSLHWTLGDDSGIIELPAGTSRYDFDVAGMLSTWDEDDLLRVRVTGEDTNDRVVVESATEEAFTSLPRQVAMEPYVTQRLPLLDLTLRDFDQTQFPTLFLSVQVDSSGSTPVEPLPEESFSVYEDGVLQTGCFQVDPGGSGMLDFTFLIDHSGSMDDKIIECIDNVASFAYGLEAIGYDVKFGYVRFGQSAHSGAPQVMNNGVLYDTAEDLLNDLHVISSGGTEPGCQATLDAIHTIGFRPGALQQFLIITDEESQYGDCEQARHECNVNNYNVHGAVYCGDGHAFSDYCNEDPNDPGLIPGTEGILFDVTDPLDPLFDYIADKINRFYQIRYCTEDLTPCLEREVELVVNAYGETESVFTSYTPGGTPVIQRTQETIDLSAIPQVEHQPIVLCAEVSDCAEPYIVAVELFYRTSGSGNTYTQVAMVDGGNGIYCAEVPGPGVEYPGVDYYVKATDGEVVTFDPSTDPQDSPYQVAVLPNEAPIITHDSIPSAPHDQEVEIHAEIVDETFLVADAVLYCRTGGSFQYTAIQMSNPAGNEYQAYIPAELVVAPDGVDYYLWAIDDLGVSSTHGTPDIPHHIQVLECVDVFVASLVLDQGTWQLPVRTTADLTLYDPIYAFEMDVLYDPDYFELSDVITLEAMTDHGLFMWNHVGSPGSGHIRIVWAATEMLANQYDSTFFTLVGGPVDGAPCAELTPITLDAVLFNEGDPCVITTDGSFEIPGVAFSGNIVYFSCDALDSNPANPPNPRPVSDVELEMVRDCSLGSGVAYATTDADGHYDLLGCTDCVDCLTPKHAQDEASPAITPWDATLLLEYLLEQHDMPYCPIDAVEYDPSGDGSAPAVLCDVPPETPEEAVEWGTNPPFLLYPQRMAADVSPNGLIQAFDAAMILMYSVGLPQGLDSRAGTWDFYCESRCYEPVIGPPNEIGDADFTAILRGDVSGDWPASVPARDSDSPPIQVVVNSSVRGDRVELLLETIDYHNLVCGYLEMTYPGAQYVVEEVTLLGGVSSALDALNSQPGRLRFAFAGTDPAPAGAFARITLRMTVGNGFHLDDLSWDRLEFNDNSREIKLSLPTADAAAGRLAWDGSTLRFSLTPSTFTSETTIHYSVAHAGEVRLAVVSIDGRLVKTLVDGHREAGLYTTAWDGRTTCGERAPAGVYFGTLQLTGERAVRRMVYIR